jgi:RsiW-degrading membrane proteinase PrsW (M82 family)
MVALSAHGLKAGTRLAANTSPEPFSNWLLSFGEDAAVLGILWMAASHPLLSLALAATVIVVAVLSVRFVLRGLRRLLSRRPVAGT